MAALCRFGTREAARHVAERIACDHDAQVKIMRTRLLHPRAGWSVAVRVALTPFGVVRIRGVTDGFAELAERCGVR